ncbi:hypothetical protein MAR_021627 [Mya arenaria]|uniref:Ig-like domain-containing protein n=1 Tax=Mya arenaria TaxID=6604 RepID=A0ABY7E870_MYAAR|nr:hypothetical protein MAR_021627 [Mya arenaria]
MLSQNMIKNLRVEISTPIVSYRGFAIISHVRVISGRSMTLNCSSLGNPSPAYAWTYPGGGSHVGPNLIFTSVQTTLAGNVTCTAWNTLSPTGGTALVKTKQATASLQVLYFYPGTETDLSFELANRMGMKVLNMLTLGGNTNYTSNDFVHKTVVLFGNVIFRNIVAEIQQSPFYSVMIDKTTDIVTHSQLTIYVRYLNQGASKTAFCSLVKVHRGKSDTIRAAVVQFLRDAELPLNKMCAFGSDGAAAMLGKKNGVAA